MNNDKTTDVLPDGFFSNPEVMIVSDAAFEAMQKIIEDGKANGPSPELVALMNRPKPWATTQS